MIHTGFESFTNQELMDRLPADAGPLYHELAARLVKSDAREADYLTALEKACEAETAGRALAEAVDAFNYCGLDELSASIEDTLEKRTAFIEAADAFSQLYEWAP